MLSKAHLTSHSRMSGSRWVITPSWLSGSWRTFLYVWMWEFDSEESLALKNWCFWTVVLEKTLESPLACKKIQPVHPKGDQSWVFIGRTDAEAEIPILWPPHAKRWLIGKDPDAAKYWKQEEKGTTEGEMVGWHHHSMDMGLGGLQEFMMDREAWRATMNGVTKSRTWLSNWTELMVIPDTGREPEAEVWCGGKRLVEEHSLERKWTETGRANKHASSK